MKTTILAATAVAALAFAGPALAEGCNYAKPDTVAKMSKPETNTAQMSTPADAQKAAAEAAAEAAKPVETASVPADTTVKPN